MIATNTTLPLHDALPPCSRLLHTTVPFELFIYSRVDGTVLSKGLNFRPKPNGKFPAVQCDPKRRKSLLAKISRSTVVIIPFKALMHGIRAIKLSAIRDPISGEFRNKVTVPFAHCERFSHMVTFSRLSLMVYCVMRMARKEHLPS